MSLFTLDEATAEMSSPSDRRYAQSHEWHKLEDGLVTIGVTAVAVEELTDITFIEVTQQQGPVKAGQGFGEIESVKATSELYCGVDGSVEQVNREAIENPGLVNEDPFGRGWLIKVRPNDTGQIDSLMTAQQYDASVRG